MKSLEPKIYLLCMKILIPQRHHGQMEIAKLLLRSDECAGNNHRPQLHELQKKEEETSNLENENLESEKIETGRELDTL